MGVQQASDRVSGGAADWASGRAAGGVSGRASDGMSGRCPAGIRQCVWLGSWVHERIVVRASGRQPGSAICGSIWVRGRVVVRTSR